MYWTVSSIEKIQRANLDGPSFDDLVTTGLDFPFGIALTGCGAELGNEPIPTLSKRALIVLALLLAGLGYAAIWRSQR